MLMSARDVFGLAPQARAIDTALRCHGCRPAMLAHGDARQVGRWGSRAIRRLGSGSACDFGTATLSVQQLGTASVGQFDLDGWAVSWLATAALVSSSSLHSVLTLRTRGMCAARQQNVSMLPRCARATKLMQMPLHAYRACR